MTILHACHTRLLVASLIAGAVSINIATAAPITPPITTAPLATPASAAVIAPATPAISDTPAAPTIPAPAPTPTPTPAPSAAKPGSAAGAAVASASGLTHISMVLLLVVGLIAGMAWLLRRLGVARNPSGTTVKVVSGVNLSNRERILVVEIADQWIVVGVAPGCINTLATMPRQEAAPRDSRRIDLPAGKNFGVWLKRTIDQRNGGNGSNSTNGN